MQTPNPVQGLGQATQGQWCVGFFICFVFYRGEGKEKGRERNIDQLTLVQIEPMTFRFTGQRSNRLSRMGRAGDYHVVSKGLEYNRVAMRDEGRVMEKGIQIVQGCGVEFAFYSKHPGKPLVGHGEVKLGSKVIWFSVLEDHSSYCRENG